MKPRILIISTAYLPMIGGAEIAIKEITDRSGSNFEFDLVCAKIDEKLFSKEKIGNINIERVGEGFWWDKYLLPFRAYKRAKNSNYRLIWAVMASYGAFSLPFIKSKKPDLKFLLTLQEGDKEEHILSRVGLFYPIWKKIFKSADSIQAISNYLADFARRHGATAIIDVVPNGVDLKLFGKTPGVGEESAVADDGRTPGVEEEVPSTSDVSVEAEVDEKSDANNITVITTSRLVPKNGVDILIRAIAIIKSEIINLKLMIIGDGPEKKNLKRLARELNVDDIVEFVGEVTPDEISTYLSRADVFVRPSRSEGLGISFLEAMACGLPVIGTPVGGIPDFLKPYNKPGKTPGIEEESAVADDGSTPGVKEGDREQLATGLFVNPENPQDLAQKIKFLIENPDTAQKIAQNGQKLVREKYTWDTVAQKMRKIFNKLSG